jgi:NAD(P)-dependent dehydrogenase (short-subunit alcohol dehydrogenase family)
VRGEHRDVRVALAQQRRLFADAADPHLHLDRAGDGRVLGQDLLHQAGVAVRLHRQHQAWAAGSLTGANKGIGLEIVKQLIAKGIDVYLGARDAERGAKAAADAGAKFVQLDVTDPVSIARVRLDHLDVLVNNAGITRGSFGPEKIRPVSLAYVPSKTAVNAVTVQYAKLLRDTPIKVNAVCPGYCATDLNNHQGYRTPAQGARIAVELATLGDDGSTGGFYDDDGEVAW